MGDGGPEELMVLGLVVARDELVVEDLELDTWDELETADDCLVFLMPKPVKMLAT